MVHLRSCLLLLGSSRLALSSVSGQTAPVLSSEVDELPTGGLGQPDFPPGVYCDSNPDIKTKEVDDPAYPEVIDDARLYEAHWRRSSPDDKVTEPSLTLGSRQDYQFFYPQQKQNIWPKVRNNGPGKVDKLVLESPELSQWNLTITGMYASCPGTVRGSPKIRCEWRNAGPGFDRWSKITMRLQSPASRGKLIMPLTLTAYVKDPATGQLRVSGTKTYMHRWDTPAAPAYEQPDRSKFPQSRSITVSAVPSADDEQARLKQHFKWADFEPAGFYLNPNMPLTVKVSGASKNGPKPQILVGTPSLVDPKNRRGDTLAQGHTQSLNNGDNVVSSPIGGLLYIRHTHKAGRTEPPVTVTLDDGPAAQPIPLFRQGETTNAQWKAMLDATKIPFAELSGKRIIVTGLAADAKIYAKKGQDQEALLNAYASIVAAQDSISGLTADAPDPRDRPSRLRPMVVQTTDKKNPNSSTYRAAIPSRWHSEVWWQPGLRTSWMLWHELGHHRQHVKTWSWEAMGEVTVNIYSLAARRLFPGETIKHAGVQRWKNAEKYLAQGADKKSFEGADLFTRLVMFEQLRVVFGDGFYHQLHANSRRASNQATKADKIHYFMTQAAQIGKRDLTDYFTRWGLKPAERTIEEMRKQPKPDQDYTTRPVYGA